MGRRTERPKEYPLMDLGSSLEGLARVAQPRASRFMAPGGTIHATVRCNNGAFLLERPEYFEAIRTCLAGMCAAYEVTLYGYTLMSNHIHLLLKGPTAMSLGRPMRWFLTESARAYNKVRGQRGHFWEHRYRAVHVDEDQYALAALRYMDRNPVRAGLLEDPTEYPWSSCAAYALGTEDRLVTYHPAYLALSALAKVCCRKYRELVTAAPDRSAERRDPRWTESRAVGSPAFVARFVPISRPVEKT